MPDAMRRKALPPGAAALAGLVLAAGTAVLAQSSTTIRTGPPSAGSSSRKGARWAR